MVDDSSPPLTHDDCVIPHSVEPEALERYLLKQSPFDGSEEIRQYVENESAEETVTYLERISSERVMGREHETWDVHTTGERYWVITNPTNLYSQRLFPSADYTLTFHVGLTARIASIRQAKRGEEDEVRLAAALRRWEQAGEALDRAHEAEDYQAVGMRCRECLIEMVRWFSSNMAAPKDSQPPKTGDVIHWSEVIANLTAAGSSAKEVRSYLKTIAKATWQFVSWLTHASSAVRFDAEMAIEATQATLSAYTNALLRFEAGIASRCPHCSSYKVASRYVGDSELEGGYVTACASCGWTSVDAEETDEPGS